MRLTKVMAAVSVAVAALAFSGMTAQAESTLAAVKKRGQLICGVSGGGVPGFSVISPQKEWAGFDVDFCRAIAAAVLGSATKVKFVPLDAIRRFSSLKAGEIDVLVRNSTVTLERTAGSGMRYAAVTFIDGQKVAVPKSLKINVADLLKGGSICVSKGVTHLANIEDWFGRRGISVTPMIFDTQNAMYEAFLAGSCSAITDDATALSTRLVESGKASDYLLLPDLFSIEPLGPFVRAGDDAWLDIVRWTHEAMLEAEERGVTRGNVDDQRQSKNPAVQRLLGVVPGTGKLLRLEDGWAYNIIKQVGNYGDSFERNIGGGSPFKFSRGINALVLKGGVMYSLPMR